jgi:cell division protein FtsW
MTFDWRQSVQALRREELPGEYDLALLLAATALAAFGLVMVGSASIAVSAGEGLSPFHHLMRHATFLALGMILALLAMRVPLAWLEENSRTLLLLAFLLLLAVLVPGLGRRINGATRWLNFGFMGFQSVEAVKLLLVIYLASYLVRFATQVRTTLVGVLKPLGIVALVVVLLLAQPDFGSAALICAIAAGMIWLGGARARDLGGIALLAMPAMALAAWAEPYRVRRLTSFMDPFADPFRDGFQLSQALIAIGRGEWFGVGLGGSVQKLYYLPEAHTDFILAVIAEELGLAGIALVLALFGIVCARAFKVGLAAVEQGQSFAGYCAFGVGLWLSVQALVSVGVNLGALPTKGLTLPLVSAGGSSMLLTCTALGLLLRVSYEVSRRRAELALAREALSPAPLEVA